MQKVYLRLFGYLSTGLFHCPKLALILTKQFSSVFSDCLSEEITNSKILFNVHVLHARPTLDDA